MNRHRTRQADSLAQAEPGPDSDSGPKEPFLNALPPAYLASPESGNAVSAIPQPVEARRRLDQLADAVLSGAGEAESQLPPFLISEVVLVREAFTHFENGEDDRAQEKLRGIGLASSCLEWKVFLRGLMAHARGDRARALEHWRRLQPARLPFRLAAPFRMTIDSDFARHQPPSQAHVLHQQFRELQADKLVGHLREVNRSLAGAGSMARAFRAAEAALPLLRASLPGGDERLAGFLYWTMLHHGPDEILRYRRAFSSPPDDPNFHRLSALAQGGEAYGPEAHAHWMQYEAELAKGLPEWSVEDTQVARALIWSYMAQHAAARMLLARERSNSPEAFQPSVEECYTRALSLHPELLEAHEGLFAYLAERGSGLRAIQAGQSLLARFPGHLPTARRLASLLGRRKLHERAREILAEASQLHPLDRDLKRQLLWSRIMVANTMMARQEYERASYEFNCASKLAEGMEEALVRCYLDFARELALTGPSSDPGSPRTDLCPEATAYARLTRVLVWKLAPGALADYTRKFETMLQTTLTADAVVALLQVSACLALEGCRYAGQASHTSKLLRLAAQVPLGQFSDGQLLAFLRTFREVRPTVALLRRLGREAERRSLSDPRVGFYLALGLRNSQRRWSAESLSQLHQAHRLAQEQASRTPATVDLLEEIQQHLTEAKASLFCLPEETVTAVEDPAQEAS
ncbi:MAG: hypothetical protein U0840_06635 [Gemmataceae bacterium]